MHINAGFFPIDNNSLKKFALEYENSLKNCDFLAVWGPENEEKLIKKSKFKGQLTKSRVIEPYYFSNPWSRELKGTKVLVIHPFVDTILEQYLKREKLFQNEEILPEFKLEVIKAPQTNAGETGGYDSWFQAFEELKKKIDQKDFDIALVSCGSYGMPVCSYIKEKNKTVIYSAGALQIFFGIKGKRWDNHPVISKLYNENWTRPKEKERPKEANKIEGGCYW